MHLSDREQMLHEVTGIFGTVLEELERRNGFRTKNIRLLRTFCDAFCEEYKRAYIPPMAKLTVVRDD